MNMKKGFTLLETLIAITILTLAVAGPLFTASRAIVSARAAGYQLTASYLAHESAEYVRELRDDYYINAVKSNPATASTTGWANFHTDIDRCSTGNGCTFDQFASDPKLAPCAGSCSRLYLTAPSSGVYTQQVVGEQTQFTRSVKTEAVSVTEERVTSTVAWTFHGMSYTITTTDHLTPWQSP